MERPHYFLTSSPTPQHQLNPGPSTPLPLSLISILDTRSPPTVKLLPEYRAHQSIPLVSVLVLVLVLWSYSFLVPHTSPFSHILLTGTLPCPVTFVIHLIPSLHLRRSLSQGQWISLTLSGFSRTLSLCVSQKRHHTNITPNVLGTRRRSSRRK